MAITPRILLEAAARFQERQTERDQRSALLSKARWRPNMDVKARVETLSRLNTPEQVDKRFKRLNNFMSKRLSQEAPFAAEGEPNLLERVLGQSDLMNITFLEKGLYVSRTVARIVVKNSLGSAIGYGTGFMISPRLLMTNNHVIADQREAALSHAEFNYQSGADGQLLSADRFSLDPGAFFLTSKDLDFTVVAVRPVATTGNNLELYGWNKLIETEGKIMIGEYMNIIQHPGGKPKEVALRANMLLDIVERYLHYETDTLPGSSGSGVFNDQWELVALHHSAVPRRDKNNNVLTRDKKIWNQSLGEDAIDWIANEGVRISRIVKVIKGMNPSAAARVLRNDIFDKEPVMTSFFPRTSEGIGSRSTADGYRVTHDADGATITIPVRLKVHIGDQKIPTIQPISSDTVNTISFPGTDTGKPVDGSSMLADDLQETLAELEASAARPYYAKAADQKNIRTYYKGIKTTSVSKKQFYKILSDHVTQTHTELFPYRPAKHLYPWIDLQPNRKLRSIYSAKEFDPAVIIEEDFQKEARLIEFSERLLRESSLTDFDLAERIAAFEAATLYNCEHVVPQSWFSKVEPMRGDLHHLFTCESGCNSFRGNTPYFDFDDFQEKERGECGKRENTRFEPESGKGEVARATLYFLLRYPGKINRNQNEYTDDRIAILIEWHNQHKVSQYEKHRNAAIFEKQGNRNPLIDKPEWVSKIDFLQGLG